MATEKNKGGRPKKELDIEVFEKLCECQMAEKQIAHYFNCHIDTVNEWCKRTYKDADGKPMTFKQVHDNLKINSLYNLRHAMYARAMGGSDKMLIHLDERWGTGNKQEPIQINVVNHTQTTVETEDDDWSDDWETEEEETTPLFIDEPEDNDIDDDEWDWGDYDEQ